MAGVRIHVWADGINEALSAFERLPPESMKILRDRTIAVSERLAVKMANAARGEGRQAAAVADTVTVRRGSTPGVRAGGGKKFGRPRTSASAVLFGSEFGANRRSGWYAAGKYAQSTGRQFRPHLGRGSYWFFTTFEHDADITRNVWVMIADDVARSFGRGA